ncbi:MAG: nucleotidyltransferase family protein [Oscillospiraceae bacterium]|nr:nucleotidyltransferase family protein [Oscillospiraceae bacterium]MBQ9906744.1 nucleotidyltransferase family protein [Oscillospiraceae bacterium]
MKISGIVCEYNPFHNGHLYHIEQTRKNGATHIVAVMSGNFVQRGDVAVINKFERAKAAVRCGADLVIELPVAYCLSAAETYAKGAMYILKGLGCVDELSFGSECGDLSLLTAAVKASYACAKRPELEDLMKLGNSYPKALQILIRQNYGDEIGAVFSSPNNTLAIEYLKAMVALKLKIQPFTVKRETPHDSGSVTGGIASASLIRQLMESQTDDYDDLVPEYSADTLSACAAAGMVARFENLDRVLLYRLRTATAAEIAALPDVGHGLENKILSARNETSLESMLLSMKSKRYPMARLRRILLDLLIGITPADTDYPPPYGRILALSERGRDILTAAKQAGTTLPFATSLAKLSELGGVCKKCAELEARATAIYGLAQRAISPADADYKQMIGMVK